MQKIDIHRKKLVGNIYIDITVGVDFLREVLATHGTDGWNDYCERLRRHDIFAAFSSPNDDDPDCAPVCLHIDLRGVDFRGEDLRSVDLSIAHLDGANLWGADLSGATIGSVDRACLARANLTHSVFDGASLSGTDFTGAAFDGTEFRYADYDLRDPPRNLPPELLSLCRPRQASEPEEGLGSSPSWSRPIRIRDAQLRSFWWNHYDHNQDAMPAKVGSQQ